MDFELEFDKPVESTDTSGDFQAPDDELLQI